MDSFYTRTREARKIIVADLGFLGDTLHLIPSLLCLRKNYPRAELHVATTPVGAEVLSMVPAVKKSWIFRLARPSPPWWQQLGTVGALRREGFDAAFNFSGADRTVFLAWATGARHRAACRGPRRHFWQPWLIGEWHDRPPLGPPVSERRLQFLKACGLDTEGCGFSLETRPGDKAWAAASVPKGAVHFSINASTPLKEWPLERWLELAALLKPELEAATLVVTAGPDPREQGKLDDFAIRCGVSNLIRIPGSAPIPRLAALLERCRLHAGPDSGALHLAVAAGIPTVSLFRRYHDMSDWVPAGSRHRMLDVEDGDLSKLPAECVAEAIRELLNRQGAKTPR
jgi:ADP-heptose:LPS heptosyltransferase